MTATVKVGLEGVADTIRDLKNEQKEHRDALRKAFRVSGQLLRTDIIANRLSNPRQPMRKGRRVRVPGTKNAWRGLSGRVAYPQVLSVLTGRLRQAIYEVWEESFRGEVWEFSERIGTNVFYARYHEFGNNRARAFLKPSVDDNWQQISQLIEAAGFGAPINPSTTEMP